jgi:nicotinamidase-related amidase
MIDLELSAERAGLVLVDWQERLLAAMPPEIAQRALQNALILIEAARRLGLPVIVSEQYPKGLGRTTPEIARALETVPHTTRFEKVQFGCGGLPEFDAAVEQSGRTHWIAAGMETHICLYQTARSLARGRTVFVPADAALSRTKANWTIGLDLMQRAGCVITSTETVAFDLLKRAGTEDFKALSNLIK